MRVVCCECVVVLVVCGMCWVVICLGMSVVLRLGVDCGCCVLLCVCRVCVICVCCGWRVGRNIWVRVGGWGFILGYA